MTESNCTASSAVSKSIYPSLVSNRVQLRVAEDRSPYHVRPNGQGSQDWEIKQIQLRALQTTGFGQVSRLYQLANLLKDADVGDWDKAQLKSFIRELHDATGQLETLLCDIVDPLAEERNADEEDDD